MKIKYLGTAAAEGIPALFCKCENCTLARKMGGKNIRTRSQALIDGKLLMDFPPDTYMHALKYSLDLADIGTLIITHAHQDHYYPEDLSVRRRGFGHVDGCPALDVYGSPDLIPSFIKCVDEPQKNTPEDDSSRVNLHVVRPFEPFFAEGYEITPLVAYHGTDNPYIYIIEKYGKSLLYAHDTDVFSDETWAYISDKKKKFDLVSLDCTEGNKHISYHGHMCIERNDETKSRLVSIDAADEKTVFVINHFSHNGKDCLYDDMLPVAAFHGFTVSYDGLEIEI